MSGTAGHAGAIIDEVERFVWSFPEIEVIEADRTWLEEDMSHARSRGNSARRYPRMARVNELLREILGEALERIDDDRLALVTVTAVECDPDLRHAKVFVDTLADPERGRPPGEALARAAPAPAGRDRPPGPPQAHPRAAFVPDPVVRSADRIEQVLRDLDDD